MNCFDWFILIIYVEFGFQFFCVKVQLLCDFENGYVITFSNLTSASGSEHSSTSTVATPNEALGNIDADVGVDGLIRSILSSLSLKNKQ